MGIHNFIRSLQIWLKRKITVATFLVALLTFLASVTPWFKQTIPIKFGFLLDNRIIQQIDLSTGDPSKPILLRFHNSGKGPLTGVVLELRFRWPLALSGTEQAIAYPTNFIPLQFRHGRTADYYLINFSELVMFGDQNMDLKVELNTQNMTPGTYKVDVIASSIKQNYKDMKAELSIAMR